MRMIEVQVLLELQPNAARPNKVYEIALPQ